MDGPTATAAHDTATRESTVAQIEEIVTTQAAGLHRFALGLGLRDDQAQDAVQETVARLWSQGQLGVSVRDPRAWCFRVLYRIAMDHHRAERRLVSPTTTGERAVPGADEPERLATWLTVRDDIDRLPSRRRQVVHLRFLADLPYAEIGTTLGISAATARSHAAVALRHLRSGAIRAPHAQHVGLTRLPPPAPLPPATGEDPSAALTLAPVELVGELQSPPGGLRDSGGIDVDPFGRIWVVDAGHDAIAIFSADGRFLERWGRPGGDRGEFSFRRGLGNVGDVRFAADGGFFVADNGNQRIQRFDAARRFVTSWGSRGDGNGMFRDPWSVRVDPTGQVHVSDALRDDVQVFTPDGIHVRTFGRAGSGAGQLDFQGDAVPSGDEVFVADHANGRIVVFDLDGHSCRTFGEGLLQGPDGLDVDGQGRIYVGDTRARRFRVFDRSGALLGGWSGLAWRLRVLPDGRIISSGGDRVTIHRPLDQRPPTDRYAFGGSASSVL